MALLHIHWRRFVRNEAWPKGAPYQIVMARRRCRCGSETLRRDRDMPWMPLPRSLAERLYPEGGAS